MAYFSPKIVWLASIGVIINGTAPLTSTTASIVLIIVGIELEVEEPLEHLHLHTNYLKAVPRIGTHTAPLNALFVLTPSRPISHTACDGKHRERP